jgi:hypothetical protein
MKKKKNKVRKIIAIAVSLALGGGIGYLAAVVGGKAAATVPAPVMIALAVLFIPAFFFVIAVHEGGHAWAGVRMNFDFRTYVVGPFLWDKQPGGWKFQWNKNINTSGGLVICIPTGTENLAKRFSFYGAGGPLASLALAIIAFGIYGLATEFVVHTVAGQFFMYLLLMVSFLSSVIFLVTAIPMHAGGFSSDGARVLRFLRGGDTAQFEVLMLKMVSSSMAGVRPGQLDKTELLQAQALGEKLQAPMLVYIHYFLYLSALDKNELETAAHHLNEYVQAADEVPEGLRGSVWLEAAFFHAVVQHNLTQAEEYLKLYKPSALTPQAVEYATRAAIANMKGEKEEFKSWITKAEHALPAMMDKGAMLLVRERMEVMKAEAIF